jgi:Ferric reductase NAD binding domain
MSDQFLPGQWLDVFVPGISKPGGFTITSTPPDALPNPERLPAAGDTNGYLELAVQDSPQNPPAAWLWRPVPEIMGQDLHVRVGGSFVWPPPGMDLRKVKRIVLVAGGVGINPLISIVSHLAQVPDLPYEIFFIYSLRDSGEPYDSSAFLFLERLAKVLVTPNINGELVVHLTPGGKGEGSMKETTIETQSGMLRCRKTRVGKEDVLEALGPIGDRQNTVCYICGVPAMTDELVEVAQRAEGMDPKKVLFERWW